jgi:hypothetical protein
MADVRAASAGKGFYASIADVCRGGAVQAAPHRPTKAAQAEDHAFARAAELDRIRASRILRVPCRRGSRRSRRVV